MNRYSIVFFDTANAKKTHRLSVTKLHYVALIFLVLLLIAVQAFLLLKLHRTNSESAATEVLAQDSQPYTVFQTAEILETAIAMLQQDDIFIREIYEDTQVINAFYSFENIAGGFSMANSFYNMYILNKHSDLKNTISMLRFTNMVS